MLVEIRIYLKYGRSLDNMFKVTLTNNDEDLDLFFSLRDTRIAHKWYSELLQHYDLYETDRFSDWNTDTGKLIEQLNSHIDIINSYDYIIDKKVTPNPSQDDLSYLHKFFEGLRGEVTVKTPWYDSAPTHIKYSIERYNVLIHELESVLRTKNNHPTLVVTFKNCPRFLLSDDDLKEFTYKWTSGTVYINYCQVGKTVLDVFKDRDSIADSIRPQTYYSADFMIKFGPSSNSLLHYIRSIILKAWIFFKKFNFENLNLGMIPVADLTTPVDKLLLLKFNKVKSVECIK